MISQLTWITLLQNQSMKKKERNKKSWWNSAKYTRSYNYELISFLSFFFFKAQTGNGWSNILQKSSQAMVKPLPNAIIPEASKIKPFHLRTAPCWTWEK